MITTHQCQECAGSEAAPATRHVIAVVFAATTELNSMRRGVNGGKVYEVERSNKLVRNVESPK